MKKVYVNAYIEKNLGDDLFLYLLARRYPDVRFYAVAKKKYAIKDNFTIRKYTVFHSIINRIISIISNGRLNIGLLYSFGKDAVVTIGGSMFMEKKDGFVPKKLPIARKEHYYLGCNFGPYYTDDYLEYHKELFRKASDVCFRDRKSYRLFSKIGDSVRYAPDIVFSLPAKKDKRKNNNGNNVLISVMDFRFKHPSINQAKYEKTIVEMINYYVQQNYNVKLMSFCKREGDERAVDSIIKKCNTDHVKRYCYDGNIEEALEEIGGCDIMIGSRYHANILGMVFNKKTIPLIYSDKMSNVLRDIGYKGDYIDLRTNDFDKKAKRIISNNRQTILDVGKIKKASEEQFKALDCKLLK